MLPGKVPNPIPLLPVACGDPIWTTTFDPGLLRSHCQLYELITVSMRCIRITGRLAAAGPTSAKRSPIPFAKVPYELRVADPAHERAAERF